jgi:RsiW-degrading membrane proteinase PrsW (M82 family)
LIFAPVAAVLVGALPLGGLAWLVRRLGAQVEARAILLLAAGGALAAAGCLVVERKVLGALEISLEVGPAQTGGALLATFLFVAPLEQAAKVAVAFVPYRLGRLDGPPRGVLYAVAIASGFAAIDGGQYVLAEPQALSVLRATAGLPAHVFCAGAWGYALGNDARSGSAWFPWVWLGATMLHGLYDHIVFGRGPGVLVLSLPLVLMMLLLGWSVLREIAPLAGGSWGPGGALLPEPPSLRAMRRALRRSDQPLMLHWIAFGALVNVGVVLVSLAAAVWLGHRLGLDFAAADESHLAANGPLVLLGLAVLLAFPLAGYLVARASGAHGVLEPAMSTALAIVLVVALLSVTAPVALLFASALAPVAFGLACGGAWFGIRH